MRRDLPQSLKFKVGQLRGNNLVHPANMCLRQIGSSRIRPPQTWKTTVSSPFVRAIYIERRTAG
jgi:hypothetical protein